MTVALARHDGPVRAPLTFETSIFGRAVERIDLDPGAGAERLGGALASLVARWREECVWLGCCRVPTERPDLAGALEAAGFYPVETLVTLSRAPATAAAWPASIRRAGPGDAEACARIAADAFRLDRFHRDPHVTAAAADALKAAWARNSVAGRADRVLVATSGDAVVGFCAVNHGADADVIDLIGVAPAARGHGAGRALVGAAIDSCAPGVERVDVGTQADNAPSLALYRRCGFVERRRQRTFHWCAES